MYGAVLCSCERWCLDVLSVLEFWRVIVAASDNFAAIFASIWTSCCVRHYYRRLFFFYRFCAVGYWTVIVATQLAGHRCHTDGLSSLPPAVAVLGGGGRKGHGPPLKCLAPPLSPPKWSSCAVWYGRYYYCLFITCCVLFCILCSCAIFCDIFVWQCQHKKHTERLHF